MTLTETCHTPHDTNHLEHSGEYTHHPYRLLRLYVRRRVSVCSARCNNTCYCRTQQLLVGLYKVDAGGFSVR
jgi:hypothetical protein